MNPKKGAEDMAILRSRHYCRPDRISRCKRTYIRAKGEATAASKTSVGAAREAKKEAKAQRDLALWQAKALPCVDDCRGDRFCVDRGTTKTGFSLDWTIPTKDRKTKLWKCRAWASYGVYRQCRCRRPG
jgi:hypothetical protein